MRSDFVVALEPFGGENWGLTPFLRESWHPQQKGTLRPDGSYDLEVPYADDRELMMDVLKYGADVEVLGPQSLRRSIADEIPKMARLVV